MDRRQFLAAGVTGAVAVNRDAAGPKVEPLRPDTIGAAAAPNIGPVPQEAIRASFPRLARERFLSAAAGIPLSTFAEAGMHRYLAFQRLGPGDGRRDYVMEMLGNIRGEFGSLIGASAAEIALVHSTKAGEHLVLDSLDPGRHGRNIVTNDMHFSGSLHHLVGLQRAGVDVRIARHENWDVPVEAMIDAMDDRTAVVAVTLVSNTTGRIESMTALSAAAHAHGAYVYADVIQAAGIVPFDVRNLGIDFAASNGYKWLYGVHGAGFLYVREDLQGTVLPDRLFPGNVTFNYPPWVDQPDPTGEDFGYHPHPDARRYEPGHVNYVGYCAVYEGLKFIRRVGVQRALEHSVALNRRLLAQLDPDRYECISVHRDRSPIITFRAVNPPPLEPTLRAANTVVSLQPGNRIRVSPALYNTEEDIDRLAAALNTPG